MGKLLVICLCGVSAALVAGISASSIEQPNADRFLPKWKTGDWWAVSSDFVTDRQNNPDLPPSLGIDSAPKEFSVFRILHKFEVSGTTEIGGDLCWVLDVKVSKLPRNVKDDTGGSPLWNLYIRQKDGTLARYAWTLRKTPCFTTGRVRKEGSRDCTKHLPVVPTVLQQCPLDVPLLSGITRPAEFLFEKDKELEFVDEWNRQKRIQTIDMMDDILLGRRERVVVVTISGPGIGSRQQKWVAGYPWWLTWSRLTTDGKSEYGLLRARLVKYGSKGEEGKTVATPEWW